MVVVVVVVNHTGSSGRVRSLRKGTVLIAIHVSSSTSAQAANGSPSVAHSSAPVTPYMHERCACVCVCARARARACTRICACARPPSRNDHQGEAFLLYHCSRCSVFPSCELRVAFSRSGGGGSGGYAGRAARGKERAQARRERMDMFVCCNVRKQNSAPGISTEVVSSCGVSSAIRSCGRGEARRRGQEKEDQRPGRTRCLPRVILRGSTATLVATTQSALVAD